MKMNCKKSFHYWALSIILIIQTLAVAVNSYSATLPGLNTGGRGEVEFGGHHDHSSGPKTGSRCEDVTIPMCKDMPYNKTILPNLMGHATQEEAGYEAHQYYALVKVQCSPDLKIFLCSLFAPVCNILHEPLPPCRELCETVKEGCERILQSFGFPWPDNLDCSRFPSKRLHELCIDTNTAQATIFTDSTAITTSPPLVEHYPSYVTSTLVCPSDWSHPEHSIGNEIQDCGPPCSIFTPQQKRIAGIVVGVIATSTLISSLFTIITAILDSNRFHYPERAIVHISICYAGLAICYIIGGIGSSDISCSDGFVVLGPGSASCTLLFMFTYFLTFASHVWWVLLCLTWYLSAGLKWGGESIAAYSLYFHLVAWGVSAFMTMTSVALGHVEGDPLAGPCSLGVQRSPELQYLIMFPIMILIIISTIFFLMGFLSLIKIRGEIKRSSTITSTGSDKVFVGPGQRSLLWDQQQEVLRVNNAVMRAGAAKLEILMARIGIFSVLYTVPAIVFLIAVYYISTPVSEGGVLLPIIRSQTRNNQFFLYMYLVRYVANLGFGSVLIVWVCSRKTFKTWKRAICGPQVK